MTTEPLRYIGMDIHKHFVMVVGIDADHQVILTPRRVSTKQLENWAMIHLKSTDQVVMEATTNVWVLHDLVRPHVSSVTVVHPFHVKIITASFVKTDKKDALALAKLLASKLAPAIWIPPMHVRELRSLISHRRHLIKQRTAAKNRLQGTIFRHNLVTPEGDLYSEPNRAWWHSQALGPIEQLRIRQDLQAIDFFTQQTQEVEQLIAELSMAEEWVDAMACVIQLPGVALVSAMTILSSIGTIQRFESADKLAGYAGLGTRIHASGASYHSGKITKQGRRELRHILIEVAWAAVQNSEIWRQRYQKIAQRRGSQKAIVAIARRILVVVWHVWQKQEPSRDTTPEAIQRKYTRWAYTHRLARSHGFTAKQFSELMMSKINLTSAPQAVAS
jgi:transposase